MLQQFVLTAHMAESYFLLVGVVSKHYSASYINTVVEISSSHADSWSVFCCLILGFPFKRKGNVPNSSRVFCFERRHFDDSGQT